MVKKKRSLKTSPKINILQNGFKMGHLCEMPSCCGDSLRPCAKIRSRPILSPQFFWVLLVVVESNRAQRIFYMSFDELSRVGDV
jgi:hypothetical protein